MRVSQRFNDIFVMSLYLLSAQLLRVSLAFVFPHESLREVLRYCKIVFVNVVFKNAETLLPAGDFHTRKQKTFPQPASYLTSKFFSCLCYARRPLSHVTSNPFYQLSANLSSYILSVLDQTNFNVKFTWAETTPFDWTKNTRLIYFYKLEKMYPNGPL